LETYIFDIDESKISTQLSLSLSLVQSSKLTLSGDHWKHGNL
jgi:hypothetical protein